MSTKRYQDPKWIASQVLKLDYNYAMAEFVGAQGLSDSDLTDLNPDPAALAQDLAAARQDGRLGFMDLPHQTEVLKEIRRVAKPVLEWGWDLLVLGIGGSALGTRALQRALVHPQHNRLPIGRRQHRPGLWVLDNIDPDFCFGILDGLDLRRTYVNVISKSGATAETLAQFLWVYQMLKNRVGEDTARERIIVTTDPDRGPLRRLAKQEGFASLSVPPNIGGRFSVLSAVGLLPAHLVGIDSEELLAGARFMDQRLQETQYLLAHRLATLYYLFAARKQRNNLVFMPYSSLLAGLAEWFCQLWAESLGKRVDAGSTPVRALGATDQHSQLQLYMEGPQDKLITFVEVEKHQHQVEIPNLYPDQEELSYLGGHSLGELLATERRATAFNLMKAGRPSLSLKLPEINAFTVGQLLYLLEVATVAAAHFFGVNPLDQPGVEGGKKTTYGLMGRQGYEDQQKEFAQAKPALEKYTVS
jgi:glucose-6-phosphate isomerase